MKKLLPYILILFVGGYVYAFQGIKKADEYVTITLNTCLDSSGLPRDPDSIHITAWRDGATQTTYFARSTSTPFAAIGIDTSYGASRTVWQYSDQIQDIDGTPGAPSYGLSICIVSFCAKLPTETRDYVQVIADSLDAYLDAFYDTTNAVRTAQAAIIDTCELVHQSVLNMNLDLDTVQTRLGINPGGYTITKYHADADTVFYYNSGGVLRLTKAFFHPGGISGQRPDSTKAIY